MPEANSTTAETGPDVESPAKPRRSKRKLAAVVCTSLLAILLCAYAGLKFWLHAAVPDDAPVIGVTFDTAWHARARISTKNYEIAVTRAGGRLLEIDFDQDTPDEILDQIDALLLTGGGDIDPTLYGGDPETGQLVNRRRDDFETALIRGAIERDMPVLGICRGIQILNVVQGGALRNLRDDPQMSKTHGIGLDSMAAHPIELAAESKLAKLLGAGTLQVNSFHGQAVDTLGSDLLVAARAADGVVEALEMPSQTFFVCTQWHPEIPPAQNVVFDAFLDQARIYRERENYSVSRELKPEAQAKDDSRAMPASSFACASGLNFRGFISPIQCDRPAPQAERLNCQCYSAEFPSPGGRSRRTRAAATYQVSRINDCEIVWRIAPKTLPGFPTSMPSKRASGQPNNSPRLPLVSS
jgi:gamma-glutamyl-gamma-aminobutyrate hydrolase PuuD